MLYRTRYQLNKVMLEYKKRKKRIGHQQLMLGIKISTFDAGKKKINVYGKMRTSVVGAEKN